MPRMAWRGALKGVRDRASSFDRIVRADRFIAIPRRGGAPFQASDAIAFVFETDRSARDLLARTLHDRSVMFVRPTGRGHYTKGTLNVLRRASGAILVFTDAARMAALIAAAPALAPRTVLASRSLLDIGRGCERATGLRLTDHQGNTVPQTGTDAGTLPALTTWFGYPATTEPPRATPTRVLLIEDPRHADGGDEERIAAAYSGACVERDGTSLSLRHGEAAPGRGLLEYDRIVSRDALAVAYLQHWGLPAEHLAPDGSLHGEIDYYGLLPGVMASIRDSRLVDLKGRRNLDPCEFLLGREGPFGAWRRVAGVIADCSAPPVQRLRAMTLLLARRTEPSLAGEAGDALQSLVTFETASRRRKAALTRLLERLTASGFVTVRDAPGLLALSSASGSPSAPRIANGPAERLRARATARLGRLGRRTLRAAIRNLRLFPDPAALARLVALRGVEEAFQYYVGFFRTSDAVRSAAERLKEKGVSTGAAERIVLARLFMSIGRSEDALAQLDGAESLNATQHGIVLTSFLRTGNVEAGLEWMRRLDAAMLARPNVAVAAAKLLVADERFEGALQVLRDAARKAPGNRGIAFFAGKIAEQLERPDETLEAFGSLVAAGEENIDILQRWARAQRATGHADEIAQALRAQMSGDGAERSGLLLSFLLAENGDLGGALHAAALAFDASPASPHRLAHLANVAGALGASEVAVDAIKRHARTSAEAGVRAAGMLVGQGRAEEATEVIEAARRAGADRLDAALASARAKLNREDLAGAARDVDLVLRSDPVRLAALLLGIEIAERRGDRRMTATYLDRASIIARGDYRVQTLLARAQESRRDYARAETHITRAARARLPVSFRHDLRTSWHAFRLRAALGDAPGAHAAYGDLVSALHAMLPPELPRWRGEPLAGRSVLLMPRGGPGDEMRALQTIARHLRDEDVRIGFLGDARLEASFRANFPDDRFIANPLAGRKGARARLRGMPRMQSGTAEIARRLGVFVRAHTFERFDYVMFMDDMFHHIVLPRMLARERPGAPALALDPADLDAAREALEALPGDGPVVTVSWRGSYFSPNRPSEAFLRVREMGPIFRHRGVRFLDTHPNSSDAERAEVRERFGVDLLRPPGIDFREDVGRVGALMRLAAANIVPPVTQRDIAAGVGAPNIWSFDVTPGISESWRVDEETGTDLWQPGIDHHSVRRLDGRRGVVDALSERLRKL